jgi:hypothetical protein
MLAVSNARLQISSLNNHSGCLLEASAQLMAAEFNALFSAALRVINAKL